MELNDRRDSSPRKEDVLILWQRDFLPVAQSFRQRLRCCVGQLGKPIEDGARPLSFADEPDNAGVLVPLDGPKKDARSPTQDRPEVPSRRRDAAGLTKDILIRHLQDNRQYLLVSGDGVVPEARPENYVVRGLADFNDVGYDENAEVLYGLAGQVVRHLKSYLPGEEEVLNVLQYHQRQLAEIVHAQMQEHYEEPGVEYEVVVNAGFATLRPGSYSLRAEDSVRGFRDPVAQLQQIPQMLFGGFEKSVYPVQRFQSDPERRFAEVLESDPSVLKWLKPQAGQIHISRRDGGTHLPDFVVETKDAKFLCEVKRRDQLRDPEVLDKAGAGARWCEGATAHARKHGGKPWSYALIADDEIGPQRSFAALLSAQ